MYKEFKEFIARGNVVDLAVAVVIVRHSDKAKRQGSNNYGNNYCL